MLLLPNIVMAQNSAPTQQTTVEKLSDLFKPRNIGNSVDLIDKIYGYPVRDDGDRRDYIIDGCGVSMTTDKGYVTSMLLKLSPKCAVDLGVYKNRLNISKLTSDIDFSDMAGAADFGLLDIAGNCCFSTIYAYNFGSNAKGNYNISLINTKDDISKSDEQADKLSKALEKFYNTYPPCKSEDLENQIPNGKCGSFSGIKDYNQRELAKIEFNKAALNTFKGIGFDYLYLSDASADFEEPLGIGVHRFDFMD